MEGAPPRPSASDEFSLIVKNIDKMMKKTRI